MADEYTPTGTFVGFTPTTEHVRQVFQGLADRLEMTPRLRGDAFNRWLASLAESVRQEVRERIAQDIEAEVARRLDRLDRAGERAGRRPDGSRQRRERSNTMSAPDYVAQAAALLTEHADCGPSIPHQRMTCGAPLPDDPGPANWHAAHQAEALAAAGLIPTSTEWGVSWRGVPQQSLGGPLTEDEARHRAIHDFALIARAVTDWKDA